MKHLQREIIKHILETIGLFDVRTHTNFSMIEPIATKKFLTNKKIAFEASGQKYENAIYCSVASINKSMIKLLAADTSSDEKEFVAVIQMDAFAKVAMRLSADKDDFGSMYFNTSDNNWTSSNTLLQGKILVGITEIAGMILEWNRLDKFDDLYKSLIGFMNFEESMVENAREDN
jgi:hypothetical protein